MRSLFVAVAALLLAVLVAQAQAGAYDVQELMDDVERLDALSTVQEAHVPTAEELTQRADDAAFLERLATALPVAPAESVPVKSDDTTLLEEEGTVTIAAANSSNPFAYDPLKERRRVCAKARSRYDHKVKAARRDCRKLPKGLKGTPAANKRAACWRSFRRYERRFRNYRARVCKGIWAPSEQKTPCDLARENFSDRVSEAVAACALKQHHDQAVCFRTVGERRKQLWAVVEEACKSKQKVPEFRIRAPSQEEEEEGTTAPVQDDKALDDGEDLRPLLKQARHHEDRLFLMRQIAQAMKTTTDRVSRLRSKAAAAATAESARPRLWRKVAKQVRRLAKLHQRFVELGRESQADASRLAIAERVKARIAKLKVELKAAAPADRAAIKARLKRLRRKHRRLVRPRDGGRAAAHRRRKRQERRRRQRVQREVRRKQQKALRRARAKKRAAKALKRLNKAMAKAHKKSKAAKSAVNNKVADAKSAAAAFKRAKKAAARAAARRRRQKKRKLKKKKGKRTKLDRKIKTFDLKAAQKDLKTLRKQERIRRKVQRKQRKNKRIYKRFIKKQKRKAQRKRKIRAKIAALKAAGVKSPIGDELDIQMPFVPAAERKKVKAQIRARRVKVAKEIKALQKNYYKQRNAINKKMNKEVEALNERITMADRSGDKKTAKKLTKKAKKLFNKAKKDVKKLRKQVKKQVKAKRRALKRFEKKLIHGAKKAARAANKKKHPKAHPSSKKAPVVAKAAPAAAAPVRK